jgi:hypothetical protein
MPKTMGPGWLTGQGRRRLRCGMWTGPVFTATILAQGLVREGYRPLRHPVSSLALGPGGWIQTVNFAVTGALCLAVRRGLRLTGDRLAGSRAGPVLVAAAGAGLVGSAAFRTDPVGGYPPGTPDMPARFSRVGTAHNLAAIPVFFGLAAAAASYGWRSWRAGQPPGFAVYCAATAVTMPVTTALAGAGFSQSSRLGGLRRPVPAGQHHHRLRLAHHRLGAHPAAHAPRHRRNILICAPLPRSAQRIADAQSGGNVRDHRSRRM